MFNPLKIFKKKEEEEFKDSEHENQPQYSESFQQKEFTGIDKEDLILSKLETINAKLDR